MASKTEIIHKDILGQDIAIGNYVAASRKFHYSSEMSICRVIRTTPKKVFLENVKDKREWSTWPHETVKLSGEDVLAFILTYA